MSNFYTEPFVSAGEMEFPARPYITAQPQNHTATGPETYVLKVIAAGAVSYQWEVYNGISWANIPGATSDTLTITIDPSMDGWRYRVIVTGADGSTVVSKAAQIAVRGVHECTLKGAIVTFNGPAEIKSLEVEINAVQDLHGQANPYPAGGGVNKMPPPTTITPPSGLTVTNSDGKLTINGTTTGGTITVDIPEFTFAESGQKIALLNSFTNGTVRFYYQGTQIDYFSLSTANRVIAGSSLSALVGKTIDRYAIQINAQTLSNATFGLMVLGTNDDATSFHPYENICPISGWDAVNVFVKGANQWDEEWELVNNKVTSLNYIPVIPDAEYCCVKPANLTGVTILYYDADYNMIGLTSIVASGISAYNFTPNSNAVWMKIQLPTHYGTTYNNDISINYPNTDHDYHAYNDTTYPITLPSTCYGGKIKDGVLRMTHGYIASYNGEPLPSTWISDRDVYAEGTTPTIGAEVVYELATPIEITLSDYPTITTLTGVNNIFADSGDISVTVII